MPSYKDRIPNEVVPYLRHIIGRDKLPEWIIEFYENRIQTKVKKIIEKNLFSPDGPFLKDHPDATFKDKIHLLQCYFQKKRIHGAKTDVYLKPLAERFDENTSRIVNDLENAKFLAILRRQENLDTIFPSSTEDMVAHLLHLEILLYIRHSLSEAHTASQIEQRTFQRLDRWVRDNIKRNRPISSEAYFTDNRFANVDEDVTSANQNQDTFRSIWYLVNGTSRLALFFQYEYITLKNNYEAFFAWVVDLSNHRTSYKKSLLTLPISGIWFLFNLIYMLLTPYRFVRTLVNEMNYLISAFARHHFKRIFHSLSQYKNIVHAVGLSLQFAIYTGLLLYFGLPLVPNPLAWLPKILPTFIPVVVLGYVGLVVGTAVMRKLYYKFTNQEDPGIECRTQVNLKQAQRDVSHADLKQMRPKGRSASPPILPQFRGHTERELQRLHPANEPFSAAISGKATRRKH